MGSAVARRRPVVRAGTPAAARRTGGDAGHFHRAWGINSIVVVAGGALRGAVERVQAGRDRHAVSDVGSRDLAAGVITPQWQRALATAVARTRLLFDEGRYVCDGVSGRLRYELRATWIGGTRILDRIERSRFDVMRRRPTLGVRDAILIAPLIVAWRPTVALT